MLQVPIHSVLDGVTVYADDSLFFVYYLIPDAPSVRLDENGHPVFLLVTYQFSADDRRDHPDLPNGGGYLNFDTELAVPEVTLAKIRATLQADVDVEWNRRRAGTPAEQASQGVAGTTEAPKVRFDSPTWTAGKVALDAPQATSLVTARVSEGSPSLLQGDTAVFNLDLTPAGATFMEDSLTKPDGSGATDLTPIQVAYDLSFWARLPAATIVVSANSSKIHEYIHNKGMGRSTDYWTPYELGILLWRRWAPRPTDNTTDTVTTTGEITVAIDQGSGSMPAEVLDALRDYAIDLVKQMITSTFFTSSPAVAPKDPKPVQGEAPRYYLREYDSVTMSLDVTLEQRSVVEWRVYPQATLESSFRGMSTTDLAHYVRKISLDDPFWRTLEVDVRAFADWAGPVNWVTVDLEYDPPGSVPKPMSFTFDSDAAGISRDTFAAALKAEGLFCMGYVPSVISDWKRLHWQDYRGPRVSWLSALEAAKVDYRDQPLPNARWRVDHALETGFDMVAPNEPMIARMAEIILKVEANVDALRDHERTAGPAAPAVRK